MHLGHVSMRVCVVFGSGSLSRTPLTIFPVYGVGWALRAQSDKMGPNLVLVFWENGRKTTKKTGISYPCGTLNSLEKKAKTLKKTKQYSQGTNTREKLKGNS